MEEIEAWLENSSAITKIAQDPYKSSFEYELKLREELVSKIKVRPYTIFPETAIGNYKVIGKNPGQENSCYIGNLLIEFENETWYATWYIYGEAHSAYGMQVGPNILVFNFSYVDENKRMHNGLISYKFLSDAIVHGEWIEESVPFKGIEELRKTNKDTEVFMEDENFDENFGFSLN